MPDNNLQELRKKLFPPKPLKEEETKPTKSTAPARVKERSLSSLVSEAHPVPRKAGKGRSRSRKASTSWSQKPQTDQQMLDLNNFLDEKKQTEAFKALSVGPKNQRTPTEKEPPRTSARLKAADKSKSISPDWEKLTCLAEAADKADYAQKPSLDLSTVENEEGDGMKAKATRRLRSPKSLMQAWRPFAADCKVQIRIKDGSMPVCYVNKYLLHKLNLKDESEFLPLQRSCKE